MGTAVVTRQESAGAIMEQVIAKGDLAKLTPDQRNDYYAQVCNSMGLNPLTRPFEYLTLNGKMVLYARRDCADQLRKINGISVEIMSRDVTDGLITVHVRAKDKTGRVDEDFGIVSLGTLKGEAAANAVLKAVTKAKRRVTLSISGLGWLDETEVEDIPASAKVPAYQAPAVVAARPAQAEEEDPFSDPPPNVDALLHAIGLQETAADLHAWGVENKPAIDRLPTATADKVRAAYHARRGELGKAAA